MFDALDTIKAAAERTGGGFSVVEFLDFEGSSVPLHVNDRWDTGFNILDGEYSSVVADETVAASFGSWVYVPWGTPRAWRCDSLEARLLNVTVPGGFEGFYRLAGESVPDRSRLPPAANRMSKRSRTRRPGTAPESWGHRRGRSYPGVRPGRSRRLVALADSAIGGASYASALDAERRLGWRSQEMQERR
jgi:hypothetical protein